MSHHTVTQTQSENARRHWWQLLCRHARHRRQHPVGIWPCSFVCVWQHCACIHAYKQPKSSGVAPMRAPGGAGDAAIRACKQRRVTAPSTTHAARGCMNEQYHSPGRARRGRRPSSGQHCCRQSRSAAATEGTQAVQTDIGHACRIIERYSPNCATCAQQNGLNTRAGACAWALRSTRAHRAHRTLPALMR
jgi:hypothetical protein